MFCDSRALVSRQHDLIRAAHDKALTEPELDRVDCDRNNNPQERSRGLERAAVTEWNNTSCAERETSGEERDTSGAGRRLCMMPVKRDRSSAYKHYVHTSCCNTALWSTVMGYYLASMVSRNSERNSGN